MNGHALDVLEFDKVVEMLVDRTSFELGAERAASVLPRTDPDAIRVDLERVTEARALLDGGDALPAAGVPDVRVPLERNASEGAVLSSEDLTAVARVIVATHRLRAFLSRKADRAQRLHELGGGLTEHAEVEQAIRAAIDTETHEVRESASRELARVRRSARRVRGRLEDRLRKIVERESTRDALQEPAIHIRSGRSVLPVKRQSGGRLTGIVHDRSGSGATLFVEPMETVPLNNELAELAAEEQREIERILRALSDLVRSHGDGIARSLAALGVFDYYRAAAELSKDLDGAPARPSASGTVRILNGRHPVLSAVARSRGEDVVPLTLSVGADESALVISGPNAGGKTVALKTVGLLVLMAQAGLHVPASPDTELPVFTDVFADIGDEQSIEQSLSTFSSHLRVIGEILRESDADSLVLLDELGAGTDPDEGASLAVAILEELTRRGARVVATTHLGSVKSFVHNHGAMANGSMAFDPDTHEPTFAFVAGVPGASRGLAIAETLGLSPGVIARAREIRDEDSARIDELLADLTERERRLEETLGAAEVERERAQLLSKDYEARLAGVREERKRIRRQALAEARDILEGARALVERTVGEIKAREAARRTIQDARRRIQERRAAVDRELESERRADVDDGGSPPDDLTAGMRVRVVGLRREATLVDLPDDRGKVRVRVKNATLEVDRGDLRPASGEATEEKTATRVSYSVPDDVEPATELHLRGRTTDEVADAVETFLSAAVVQGLSVVRIVHGKGTGALREKTHEVLRGLPGVRSFRLGKWGEGDTGVTIVELD